MNFIFVYEVNMKQLSCVCCKYFLDCPDSKEISDGFDCHRFSILPCLKRWVDSALVKKTIDDIELALGREAVYSYRYLGYHFLSLEDAEAFRDLHLHFGINHKDMEIAIDNWLIGAPRFVDVETSFETGILTWYD
jgi:hypothetical protein